MMTLGNRTNRFSSWLATCSVMAALGSLSACTTTVDEEQEVQSIVQQTRASKVKPPKGFSESEWSTLLTMSPLPALSPDTTNAFADDCDAARLGQKFFFDTGFSGPLKVASDLGEVGDVGKVSCASCHSGDFFDDRRSLPRNVSLGTDFHSRNAPAIVNSSLYQWTNWGGRFSAQWELPMPVTESGVIMNGNRLQVAHRIFSEYRREYERAFEKLPRALGADPERFPAEGKPKAAPTAADGAWETMTPEDQMLINGIFVNYSKALAAYFRKLRSDDAPFDRFMAGKKNAMGESAQRGAQLFVGKAHCSGCHSGPFFADQRFHNIGVPQVGDHVPATDDGRFKDVPGLLASGFNSAGEFSDDPSEGARRLASLSNPMPESARGAFRTPSLRGVALTEPYMHSGQLGTLEEVVDFYDQGGGAPVTGTKSPFVQPLGLTEQEKSDLVSFLYALTGKPAPRKYTREPH
jgi:cytochrome c peroxidase